MIFREVLKNIFYQIYYNQTSISTFSTNTRWIFLSSRVHRIPLQYQYSYDIYIPFLLLYDWVEFTISASFFVILRERVIGNHASKYFHSRRSMSVSPSMQCISFTSIDTCNISKIHIRARLLLECTRLSREYQMTC